MHNIIFLKSFSQSVIKPRASLVFTLVPATQYYLAGIDNIWKRKAWVHEATLYPKEWSIQNKAFKEWNTLLPTFVWTYTCRRGGALRYCNSSIIGIYVPLIPGGRTLILPCSLEMRLCWIVQRMQIWRLCGSCCTINTLSDTGTSPIHQLHSSIALPLAVAPHPVWA